MYNNACLSAMCLTVEYAWCFNPLHVLTSLFYEFTISFSSLSLNIFIVNRLSFVNYLNFLFVGRITKKISKYKVPRFYSNIEAYEGMR